MTSAVPRFCAKCGLPLGVSAIWENVKPYHFECAPHPIVAKTFDPDPPSREYVDILKAEIDLLRAELARQGEALKLVREIVRPFAKNPDASSLAKVYAHLTREHAQAARAFLSTLEGK